MLSYPSAQTPALPQRSGLLLAEIPSAVMAAPALLVSLNATQPCHQHAVLPSTKHRKKDFDKALNTIMEGCDEQTTLVQHLKTVELDLRLLPLTAIKPNVDLRLDTTHSAL